VTYVPDPDNLTDVDRYWVGYFRADGSLAGGSAVFSQVYREPVAEFVRYLQLPEERCRHFTGLRATFPDRSSVGPYEAYRATSVRLAEVYTRLGVKASLQDHSLYSSIDFWRGMIDGDGCVHVSERHGVHLALCGAYFDVDRFADFCEAIFDKRFAVTKKVNIFNVTVAGDKAKYLCRKMYVGKYSALPHKRQSALTAASLPYGREGRNHRYRIEERAHEAAIGRESGSE
jgi:hypothetical protein